MLEAKDEGEEAVPHPYMLYTQSEELGRSHAMRDVHPGVNSHD
jgi:hypothetical protein